ncbi:polyketide cyclase [Pedobacter psychrophilus]|uniref:Polyketide cyclase n=1 Tax=Pedobacter psychrophilus TaxID=1826909 RepID=A0A179DRG0_9SPHI|nr:SRPBCC family protein [Pedobacter psychrophilus]OAQ43645.1 polyketide cyclase [Pedobacter psychrophilus]
MDSNNLKYSEAQMQIRKSISEVFQAFIDPEITKHFWFTNSSGKLEVGKPVSWTWEMYNFSTEVIATEILKNKKISIDWFTADLPTKVDFEFKPLKDGTTFVKIKHYDFNKIGDELIEALKDSTGGFTIVLAGLKAYLEHNIELNLIADKFPKEIAQHGN